MIFSAIEHERRSRQVADSLRNMLIGLNTGGIAVTLAVASKLYDAPHEISPAWAGWPLLFFVASLTAVAVSMIFAKGRELGRRKKALEANLHDDHPQDEKVPWWEMSSAWDGLSLVLFLVGFTLAMSSVSTFVR